MLSFRVAVLGGCFLFFLFSILVVIAWLSHVFLCFLQVSSTLLSGNWRPAEDGKWKTPWRCGVELGPS